MWREVKLVIEAHRRFVLTTHVYPDGDGVGSAVALAELLLAQGKEVRIVCDGPLPVNFQFLDEHKLWEIYDEAADYRWAEVVVVLDTGKRERLGGAQALLDIPDVVPICIDHHLQEEPLTRVTVNNPQACAVGAMVYTLFKESGFALNLVAARGIYTSVVCDTGRFSYSSTSRKAHKVADECLKLGVDPDFMHRQLFAQIPVPHMQVVARALHRMEVLFDGAVVVQRVERADYGDLGVDPNDLDFIHDLNKSLKGVVCAALLRELPDGSVRLSLRSSDRLDCVAIVAPLGGGGHARAAGAHVEGPLESAHETLVNGLDLWFRENPL